MQKQCPIWVLIYTQETVDLSSFVFMCEIIKSEIEILFLFLSKVLQCRYPPHHPGCSFASSSCSSPSTSHSLSAEYLQSFLKEADSSISTSKEASSLYPPFFTQSEVMRTLHRDIVIMGYACIRYMVSLSTSSATLHVQVWF